MTQEIRSPMAATVVEFAVAAGQAVRTGDLLAIVEAMKMEHELRAPHDARVLALLAQPGELVGEGDGLLRLGPVRDATPAGLRTARENIADLCDPAASANTARWPWPRRPAAAADDLMRNTPADGMVTGIGSVNGAGEASRPWCWPTTPPCWPAPRARNHQKTDRMLGMALHSTAARGAVCRRRRRPAGRHRHAHRGGPACAHLRQLRALSGQVPVVGIAAGRCFAGNAALLGCCDVIIATRASNIGMGGPAMIEGGGLGVFKPEQIGPAAVQHRPTA
jgi:acetyl-CoA carboxylase carboxyltransferase component